MATARPGLGAGLPASGNLERQTAGKAAWRGQPAGADLLRFHSARRPVARRPVRRQAVGVLASNFGAMAGCGRELVGRAALPATAQSLPWSFATASRHAVWPQSLRLIPGPNLSPPAYRRWRDHVPDSRR